MIRFSFVLAALAMLALFQGSPCPAAVLPAEAALPGAPAPDERGLEFVEHVPPRPQAHAALIVALHGCGQTPADFARGTGWNELADRHGFYVLYPVQSHDNNSMGCFNWFDPKQTSRGQGEVRWIKERVDQLKAQYSIDPARVYVTGLSAGAGLAVALLACYPDVFAGGSICAGLPYRSASSSAEAWQAMSIGSDLSPAEWGNRVRAANPGYSGPVPRVVIFHGTGDHTVVPANAIALARQWTNLHAIDMAAGSVDSVAGHRHTTYRTAQGQAAVELYEVNGMKHAVPIDPGAGEAQGGTAGQYFEAVHLYAPHLSLEFFGLLR